LIGALGNSIASSILNGGGNDLELQRYLNIRPYLYHLTARSNRAHIADTRMLFPAATLMQRARCEHLLRVRRVSHERLTIDGITILVRDQTPLHEGNLALPKGYLYADLIGDLNRRVFFWPGTARGPISYGINHFGRYKGEKPIIIRVRFDSLLQANPMAAPEFCKYNSGAPRCSYGRKSPRGPNTFVSASHFSESPSQAVEVTFCSSVAIPANTEYGNHPEGPWHPLL
jgi:hypothetical protein